VDPRQEGRHGQNRHAKRHPAEPKQQQTDAKIRRGLRGYTPHVSAFLRSTYVRIKDRNLRERLFILVSFILTFAFIRTVTHLQKANILPDQHGPVHIHHMVPGIISVLIAGNVGIAFWSRKRLRLAMAVLYGVGAALTLDEFALWLYVKDVYWAKQGRTSVDAVILALTVLGVVYVISAAHDHVLVKRAVRRARSSAA